MDKIFYREHWDNSKQDSYRGGQTADQIFTIKEVTSCIIIKIKDCTYCLLVSQGHMTA